MVHLKYWVGQVIQSTEYWKLRIYKTINDYITKKVQMAKLVPRINNQYTISAFKIQRPILYSVV